MDTSQQMAAFYTSYDDHFWQGQCFSIEHLEIFLPVEQEEQSWHEVFDCFSETYEEIPREDNGLLNKSFVSVNDVEQQGMVVDCNHISQEIE